ncbi:heparinase II/III family protein [Pseudomonas sp. Z1-14]
MHAARNAWIDFSIGYSDLAFGIQNNWHTPVTSEVSEIKLYFKGRPLPEGSTLEIESISCWKQSENVPPWLRQAENSGTPSEHPTPRLSEIFIGKIYSYLEKCFRDSDHQVESFLKNGTCPLYGNQNLSWPSKNKLPETFQEVGTYRFSWHALHPAAMLMIYSRNNDSLTALFSAREFISNWLEQSYFSNDLDKKFCWYDHGTAERVLTFILMWDVGTKYNFDSRFMNRLREATFKHAQLLSSEMFYASHQSSRYHNHAWFQDMALLAAALAMPDLPCANQWTSTALTRLEDQLEKLIIRDSGYSVFIENSIGYHQGVQRLIAFAGELALLSSRESTIPDIADELVKFSDLLKYPDGRSPAQGDTFRRSNPVTASPRRPALYEQGSFTILPEAGYAIIKGNHDNSAFMISMFSTSLCKTHKHQDNLSFTLFLGGVEWLIDPSFYSHEYAKPIENFLRSAWAHNNLAIKNANYTIDPGHSRIVGNCVESSFNIQGTHTAYEGHEVSRYMKGSTERLDFSITDFFVGDFNAEAYTLFHCGEGVIVTPAENGVTLTHPTANEAISIISTYAYSVITGWNEDRADNAGSGLGFMEKSETTIIAFKVHADTKATFNIVAY